VWADGPLALCPSLSQERRHVQFRLSLFQITISTRKVAFRPNKKLLNWTDFLFELFGTARDGCPFLHTSLLVFHHIFAKSFFFPSVSDFSLNTGLAKTGIVLFPRPEIRIGKRVSMTQHPFPPINRPTHWGVRTPLQAPWIRGPPGTMENPTNQADLAE